MAHVKLVTSDQLERESGQNQIQSPSPYLNGGVDNASRVLNSILWPKAGRFPRSLAIPILQTKPINFVKAIYWDDMRVFAKGRAQDQLNQGWNGQPFGFRILYDRTEFCPRILTCGAQFKENQILMFVVMSWAVIDKGIRFSFWGWQNQGPWVWPFPLGLLAMHKCCIQAGCAVLRGTNFFG